MPTTYTTRLGLALPATGELEGTWGDTVNSEITQLVDEAIAGLAVINTWVADSHTLTTGNGITAEARNAILRLTDTGVSLTGAGTLIVPNTTKIYSVLNETLQDITVKTAAGTGVLIQPGDSRFVVCDGTNVVAAEFSVPTLDQVTDSGNTTTNAVTVGNLTSTGIDDNASATALTIDSSGNVGIGTSSPSSNLHIEGATSSLLVQDTGANSVNAFIEAGTIVGIVRVERQGANQSIVELEAAGNTGSIKLGGLNATPSRIVGSNGFLSFENNAAERMRIDSSGNLLIGNSSTSGVINGDGAYIDSVGRMNQGTSLATAQYHQRYYNPNGLVGQITTTGTATSFVTSSDVRLKENIVDAADASEKIDAIQVRQFDWKADGSHQDYGFIAQELVNVAPEAVSQGETWGVDPSKLVPMLVKEIQSLRQRVAQLETS